MGNKVIVNALTHKYAELLGELLTAEREIETVSGLRNIQEATERIDRKKAELEIGMDHICHVAQMFDPTWDRAKIKPKMPRQAMSGRRGDKVRMVIEILREADRSLTAREIARRMFPSDTRPTETEVAKFEIGVRAAMKRAVARGFAILEPGTPMRWSRAVRRQSLPAS